MFGTNTAMVAIAIIAIIGVVYAIVRVFEAKETRQREAKNRREKKIREVLPKYTFTVVVRTKDGRKTDFETILIGEMVNLGLKVLLVDGNDVKEILATGKCESIPEDAISIVGVYETSGDSLSSVFWLDMRAAVQTGAVVAARAFAKYYGRYQMAGDVLSYLADILPETASAAKQ